MNNRPECAVKNCKNEAFIGYGNNWICGECYYKLYLKEMETKNKMLEELE